MFTWNCAGNAPPTNFDISHLLFNEKEETPDFFIIGLQEMVKLNAKSVL